MHGTNASSNKAKICLEDGHGHGHAWQWIMHWQCPLGMSWAHSCSSKACPVQSSAGS